MQKPSEINRPRVAQVPHSTFSIHHSPFDTPVSKAGPGVRPSEVCTPSWSVPRVPVDRDATALRRGRQTEVLDSFALAFPATLRTPIQHSAFTIHHSTPPVSQAGPGVRPSEVCTPSWSVPRAPLIGRPRRAPPVVHRIVETINRPDESRQEAFCKCGKRQEARA